MVYKVCKRDKSFKGQHHPDKLFCCHSQNSEACFEIHSASLAASEVDISHNTISLHLHAVTNNWELAPQIFSDAYQIAVYGAHTVLQNFFSKLKNDPVFNRIFTSYTKNKRFLIANKCLSNTQSQITSTWKSKVISLRQYNATLAEQIK